MKPPITGGLISRKKNQLAFLVTMQWSCLYRWQ